MKPNRSRPIASTCSTQARISMRTFAHRAIVPIPGTKRRRYLEENVAAAAMALDAGEDRPAAL